MPVVNKNKLFKEYRNIAFQAFMTKTTRPTEYQKDFIANCNNILKELERQLAKE